MKISFNNVICVLVTIAYAIFFVVMANGWRGIFLEV